MEDADDRSEAGASAEGAPEATPGASPPLQWGQRVPRTQQQRQKRRAAVNAPRAWGGLTAPTEQSGDDSASEGLETGDEQQTGDEPAGTQASKRWVWTKARLLVLEAVLVAAVAAGAAAAAGAGVAATTVAVGVTVTAAAAAVAAVAAAGDTGTHGTQQTEEDSKAYWLGLLYNRTPDQSSGLAQQLHDKDSKLFPSALLSVCASAINSGLKKLRQEKKVQLPPGRKRGAANKRPRLTTAQAAAIPAVAALAAGIANPAAATEAAHEEEQLAAAAAKKAEEEIRAWKHKRARDLHAKKQSLFQRVKRFFAAFPDGEIFIAMVAPSGKVSAEGYGLALNQDSCFKELLVKFEQVVRSGRARAALGQAAAPRQRSVRKGNWVRTVFTSWYAKRNAARVAAELRTELQQEPPPAAVKAKLWQLYNELPEQEKVAIRVEFAAHIRQQQNTTTQQGVAAPPADGAAGTQPDAAGGEPAAAADEGDSEIELELDHIFGGGGLGGGSDSDVEHTEPPATRPAVADGATAQAAAVPPQPTTTPPFKAPAGQSGGDTTHQEAAAAGMQAAPPPAPAAAGGGSPGRAALRTAAPNGVHTVTQQQVAGPVAGVVGVDLPHAAPVQQPTAAGASPTACATAAAAPLASALAQIPPHVLQQLLQAALQTQQQQQQQPTMPAPQVQQWTQVQARGSDAGDGSGGVQQQTTVGGRKAARMQHLSVLQPR